MKESYTLKLEGKEWKECLKEAYNKKLSAIVKAVDEGKSELDGVSARDFAIVKEARTCKSTLGGIVGELIFIVFEITSFIIIKFLPLLLKYSLPRYRKLML